MYHSSPYSPTAHRLALRDALARTSPILAPGVGAPLFARLVARAGFPAVYISGASLASMQLGRPDVGLVTMTETVETTERVCDVVDLPIIVDADTGYGGVHNVARTVRALERAGAAAIQLEDQVAPKRCGHLAGKEVVPVDEMCARLRGALGARADDATVIIARTDAAGPEGLEAAIRRARRYGEAGADVLFVEAPRSEDDLVRIGSSLQDWPLVANMVEFGQTPLLPLDRLAELGFSLVIHPGLLIRAIVPAALAALTDLAETGTSAGRLAPLATFDEVNDIVGLPDLLQLEGLWARPDGLPEHAGPARPRPPPIQ
jgi:2,3-dimethylmalate lyase